jgi:TRAP-type C4-dicarboxylate transport system permease small subunit
VSEPIDEWVVQLGGVLGIDPGEVDVDALLDLARDAAHRVARPAAPLTAFMVGLAAGRGGDIGASIAAAHALLELPEG